MVHMHIYIIITENVLYLRHSNQLWQADILSTTYGMATTISYTQKLTNWLKETNTVQLKLLELCMPTIQSNVLISSRTVIQIIRRAGAAERSHTGECAKPTPTSQEQTHTYIYEPM